LVSLSTQRVSLSIGCSTDTLSHREDSQVQRAVSFGADPVTQDLPLWFDTYNGRQTIEAGIKEGKQVFQLHRLKVRSEPAIYLQEQFVIFAANFIRWATHWLAQEAVPVCNALAVNKLGVKKQVQVAAHVSAEVLWDSDGWLLTFSEYSAAFAGRTIATRISGNQERGQRPVLHP
jgi:hypothetical protein